MNGVHDMGGMHGFGPVTPETDEPVFHGEWEGRVMAMSRAMGATGQWNIDLGRHAQERLPPTAYLGASYYQRWLLGLETLLLERGLVTAAEIEAGHSADPGKLLARKLKAEDISKGFTRGDYNRPAAGPARFKAGDQVRTINTNPATHTRLPRYARDKVGVVEAIRGCHVFPDSVTTGQGEDPHWLYTVVFTGRALWGEQAAADLTVSIEAWEPYLVPA